MIHFGARSYFKRIERLGRGVNIHGGRPNHLRFADDVVLFADNEEDLKIW